MLEPPHKEPRRSLIVLIPTDYAISSERIAEGLSRAGPDANIIVACAGQPATLAAIHAQLRDAEFLLAPRGTSTTELRMHALAQASGDILYFVGAERVPDGALEQERIASAGNAPSLSIIVPVCDAQEFLDGALSAILASDLRNDAFELIIVDDASEDESLTIAARHADTIIRLGGYPRGAAYARNRGAEQARGQTLAFVNADVRVLTDTFSRLCAEMENSNVAAIGASNDGTSGERRLAARYWNLLHNYGAQTHGGQGTNFDVSCGVIRRNAFLAVGMYNEWLFQSASLEGLELGQRLHLAGHTVMLSREITVSHLRHHDVLGVLRTTWRHAGVLVRSLGYVSSREHAASHVMHALSIPIGLLGLVFGAGAAVAANRTFANVWGSVGIGLLVILVFNAAVHLHFARKNGVLFSMAAVPLHFLTQMVGLGALASGFLLRHLIGDPAPDATTQAFAEVGVKMWPPVPRKRASVKQESQR